MRLLFWRKRCECRLGLDKSERWMAKKAVSQCPVHGDKMLKVSKK